MMEFYVAMVIRLTQTAPQGALAIMANGNVNLGDATVTPARPLQMDTSVLLMAFHMTTREPVNMC